MSGKRVGDSSGLGEGPPSKRQFVAIPPVNLGPIATEEELDIKVLKFQNKQLYNRLEEKNVQEEELKAKAADLERLRSNDQAIISCLNRAWNQLDEDVNLLLQRFEDTSTEDDVSETTVAFLERLSNRTTKGMQEEMQKRVTYSMKIISRLVKAIDKTLTRSMDISKMLLKTAEVKKPFEKESSGKDFLERSSNETGGTTVKSETMDTEEAPGNSDSDDVRKDDDLFDISSIELAIKQENAELKEENARLNSMVTSLHDKYNSVASEFSEVHDKYETVQKDLSESNTRLQDMQYDLQKAQHQVEKLIKRINEIQEEGKGGVVRSTVLGNASDTPQDDDTKAELEEYKELAKNRLAELEKMHEINQELLKNYETLKNSTTELTEKAVLNSVPYKTLQSQFTLLFAEGQQLRNQAEEARKIAVNNRNQHILQMEQLEGESISTRKKIRSEVGQLERTLMESRRELELLRVEYEHNMKAHEQIGPMAKEMRHLINSLQNHNQQLKGEVTRSKRKLNEALAKITEQGEISKESPETKESPVDIEPKLPEPSKPLEDDKTEDDNDSPIAKSDPDDTEYVKKLKSKLKQAKENQKEMKLLLDMYKGASKETRDKAELLRIEKQLREEVRELRRRVDQLTRDISKKSNLPPDEDAPRKLKHAEETIEQLKRSLANTKQEEDALLAEMEFTAQAFEEMQEQNIRLMQQLREKDDANLKLMSERIKANQVQKVLREEKEVLQDQVAAMNARYQAMEEVIKRLEEREKVLQNGIQSLEKEIALRQQASELHKRKALETTQQSQELQYKLEESDRALNETKESLVDKSNRLEEEAFKCRRMYEENTSIKRKLEKAKKMEYLGASDEILVEEVKMYKSKLTCPCCNTRRKDAILTKCFHVFCFECLKTRYDTRQRKCPKCNATFGNNDFHKIYM